MDPGLNSFSPFQEACAVIFLSRALPAASCDSKLSLGSGVQSSELSRRSLAYPCPTEINLARPVRKIADLRVYRDENNDGSLFIRPNVDLI